MDARKQIYKFTPLKSVADNRYIYQTYQVFIIYE